MPARRRVRAGRRRVRLRADHRLRGRPGHARLTSRRTATGVDPAGRARPGRAPSPSGGDRANRLWIERDAWLPYIDILKMNLEEAGCSWFPTGEAAMTTTGEPLAESEDCRGSPSIAWTSGVKARLRHPGRERLRRLLPRRRRGLRGAPGRPAHGRARGGHHRLRRLVRRRHGASAIWSPRLSSGRLPVRQRDGRPALLRHPAGGLPAPAPRPNEQIDAHVRRTHRRLF